MLTFAAMKSHFIRLFNYNKYASKQINGRLLERGAPGEAVKLMAHLLCAEQVWLARCKSLYYPAESSWPDWHADMLDGLIDSNHNDWVSFLTQLQDDDLDSMVSYKTFAGVPYEDKLIDIISHVLNHGTHTRAQIGQHLKTSPDDKLPATDYSLYIRQILPLS